VGIAHEKLPDFNFEALKHPAYSPDLAPLDYCRFPNLKERKFLCIEEATLAADRWLAPNQKNFS
jgi:hypothetical protein